MCFDYRMIRSLAFALFLSLPVLAACKRREPPPPEPPPAGPTAEDVAKWTKIRADYEASAKTLGTQANVVAAMLALIDEAKSTGLQVSFGVLSEKKLEHGDMAWDGALGLKTNSRVLDLNKECPLDVRATAEHVSFFGGNDAIPTTGILITGTLSENPEPLRLEEGGTTREVRQLQAVVEVKITPPGGAPVVVERKVDVRGFQMSGMIERGMVFSKGAIYDKQLAMLHARACAAIPEILGLRDPAAK